MRFLRERFYADAGSTVEVTLSRRGANVMLLSDAEFRRYERGENFGYYGGNYDLTTVTLSVPSPGYWNLIVDLGGAPGTVNASYSVRTGSGAR